MAQEEIRKGPWTEQEDLRLIFFVGIFGERRWDFIAKVSGLNRTGKSCRLRWVNYLHPGLKRGRMTPQEERLILELHSRWGNRWSRIARKLPGRTDNEIKNYWRTHMRKKAQERKRKLQCPSSSSSSVCHPPLDSRSEDIGGCEEAYCKLEDNGSSTTINTLGGSSSGSSITTAAFGGKDNASSVTATFGVETKGYSMDQIWNEIASVEMINNGSDNGSSSFSCLPMASPAWDCSFDPLWKMEDDELHTWLPTGDPCCVTSYNQTV